MPTASRDTIFACATAPGRAGIAIVRISGPRARQAIETLGARIGRPRTLTRADFREPRTSELIDSGLSAFFPGAKSYTGEEYAELHVHGSRAVLSAILDLLGRQPGFRPAEAGEFTRRAFENGKLDLTEAEAVADLVDAETAAQRRQALRQLAGVLGRLYEGWRGRLLRALAHLEAIIDFPDEDLPSDLAERIAAGIDGLRAEIGDHLADSRRGERLRDGISIAILGPPNAGKSSLINALARRDVAITAATPGTTRDVIEVHLDLGGYPVILSDTAGLRETVDDVEAEGVRRSRARAAVADLKMMIVDINRPQDLDPSLTELVDEQTMVIANKIDLVGGKGGGWTDDLGRGPALRISVRTGEGLEALLQRLAREVAERFDTAEAPVVTRARHRAALEACLQALDRFEAAGPPELAAEELRLAARALGRITGRVDVEDILDIVFRDFCIGK